MKGKALVPQEVIETKIYLIRGQKVMLDHDLALLYKVETKYLKRQIRRNLKRFPSDFMFKLTEKEAEILKSQFVTSNLRCQNVTSRWGGRRYLPYALTEQGVAMLSSVLNSQRAIDVNIQIMRTFVKLRHILSTHKELRLKIEEMEKKYDGQFKVVFDAIRQLMAPPEKTVKKIGFHADG